MKYLLLIFDADEAVNAAVSTGTLNEMVAQHGVFGRTVREAGVYVESHRLRPSREASTLRRRGETWVVTDGPFAESREVLGGYYLLECDSRDEAVAWAMRLPLLDGSAVEARPARTGAQWRGTPPPGQRYMVMFVADADVVHPRSTVYAAIEHHFEVGLDLAAQGQYVSSRALEPPASAVTVRRRSGERVITDGPFAESKEFVAGYFVVACADRAEAVEVGKRLGGIDAAVEIRPVWPAS